MPQGCMEASCESAKRDELRPRVLGNVVKIIIKAVTTPYYYYYYLFVRLTRVPTTPRSKVRVSAEIATDHGSRRCAGSLFIGFQFRFDSV